MPLTLQMTLSQRLKNETAEAHIKTEERLAPRLASIGTYGDYASVLRMFYGYFSVMENSIKTYINNAILPDINERRNSLFILKDLEAINHSTINLLVCSDVPPINSIAQALGAMYVLEGSTLGGRMICKMLMKNSFVSFTDSNLNFFSGYKGDTGSKWKTFLLTIEECECEADEVIASANASFGCLTKWMEKSL